VRASTEFVSSLILIGRVGKRWSLEKGDEGGERERMGRWTEIV
jgi:hypothetical protein